MKAIVKESFIRKLNEFNQTKNANLPETNQLQSQFLKKTKNSAENDRNKKEIEDQNSKKDFNQR